MAFVVAVVYTDWRYRRIPNAFTYPVMLVGLVLGGFEAVPGEVFANGLLDHVAGLVVGFLIAYPFYAMGGLKAGDGKYLMAVGALRGLSLLLAGAVYGALLGGVMKTWIPYGVALGLGTLLALAVELSGRLPGATM